MNEQQLLEIIRRKDQETINGGYHVHSGHQDIAERLVDRGKVVRLRNPAGVSPIYYPVDTDNLGNERVKELVKKQSANPEFFLCYVKGNFAWFTSLSVEDQWGDDWDDAPYEHNAGDPYSEEGTKHRKVAFDGPLYQPNEGPRQRSLSVEDVNSGDYPWLIERHWSQPRVDGVRIDAGTNLSEFIDLVGEAGGTVYTEVNQ